MTKEYWITNSRFKFIAVVLFLMLCVFMLLIFMRGTEIANNPCSICAKKLGVDVTCFSGMGLDQKTIIYEGQSLIELEGGKE